MTPRCAWLLWVALLLPVAPVSAESLFQVDIRKDSDRAPLTALGVVEDYGSYVVVRASRAQLRAAGVSEASVQALSSTLSLRGYRFDPISDALPDDLQDPRAWYADGAADQYLVQFDLPVREAWLREIEAAGGRVIQYLPERAWVVAGDAAMAARVRALPRVRAVLAYHPAFKLAADLRAVVQDGASGPRRVEIAVVRGAPATAAARATGVQLLQRMSTESLPYEILRAEADAARLLDLARMPGVLGIDPAGPRLAEDEKAALIVAGNYSDPLTLAPPGYDPLAQFGVNGNQVTVAVADDGIGIPGDGGYYVGASNAINGPLRGASAGAAGHGHLQASIIAGAPPYAALDSEGYNYGMGIAPGAHVVNLPLLRAGYSGTDVQAADDAVSTAGPNGVRATISNNSWGDGVNGNHYDALAALFDALTRDASLAPTRDPLLFVFSAGNVSNQGLTRPKVAKNLIAVGASENIRPTLPTALGSTAPADNLDEIPDFSSRGPAADGRVKPDLVAPGEAITGGRSGVGGGNNIDLYHRVASGTSHAAPQVAGAAALYTQAWKASHAGVAPSPAMIKAALINGAVELTGAGAGSPIPNGAEGWGRVHLRQVLNTTAPQFSEDQRTRLTEPGEVDRLYARTHSDSEPLRITLVWSDAPGFTDPALVNDLDLEVEVGGVLYRGNVLLGGQSMPGGSADRLNNVERIILPPGIPAGTSLRIRVLAQALNGDGVPGAGDSTDQDYALVCLNCVEEPGFRLRIEGDSARTCAGTPWRQPLTLEGIAGYGGAVTLSQSGLPTPASASYSPNPVGVPGVATLTLNDNGLAPGSYAITLSGVAGALTRQTLLRWTLADAPPAVPALTLPADGASAVASSPTLQWQASAQAYDYRVQIASDPAFAQLVASAETRATSWQPVLQAGQTYYWRVIARNACSDALLLHRDGFEDAGVGSGVASAIRSLSTAAN